jgi:hypothetical protein
MTLLVSSSISADSELVDQPEKAVSNQQCFEAIHRELNLGARNTASLVCLKRLRENLLNLLNPENRAEVYPSLRRVIGIKRADRKRDLRSRPEDVEEQDYVKNGIAIQEQLQGLDFLWERFEEWFSADAIPSMKVKKRVYQVYVTVWKRIYEIEESMVLDQGAVNFFRSKVKKIFVEGESLGLAEADLYSVVDSNVPSRAPKMKESVFKVWEYLDAYQQGVLDVEDEANKRIEKGVSEDDMDAVLDHMEELFYEIAQGYAR